MWTIDPESSSLVRRTQAIQCDRKEVSDFVCIPRDQWRILFAHCVQDKECVLW